jgi:alkylation response protein AidB-like acyl-CoA dehydrogenase
MARVPKSDGHRGGITAFIVEADSPGVEVLHRNAFMGLRGIENSVTRFTDVRVPAQNVIGGEGKGLKIALATLNTGRLSLPAISAVGAKWSLQVAREWSNELVQWGAPIGKHEAVAKKIAYIAGMADGLESIIDLSMLIADQGEQDIRIEAALSKLYATDHGWQVADELMQIRGGRGYETAASLAARGEQPVPVEEQLRDSRIMRIFEGSSEIMKLFNAREAVDTHPDTLTSAHHLGQNLAALGDHDAARHVLDDTLERQRRVLGPSHPDTLRTESSRRWPGPAAYRPDPRGASD